MPSLPTASGSPCGTAPRPSAARSARPAAPSPPSLPAAVGDAKVIVVRVSDHDATMSLLQADGLASALNGRLLVQLNTVSPDESRALGKWADERGVAYLDGSILGLPHHVRSNECLIIYSGSKTAFDANRAVLAAMGGGSEVRRGNHRQRAHLRQGYLCQLPRLTPVVPSRRRDLPRGRLARRPQRGRGGLTPHGGLETTLRGDARGALL